MDRAPTAIVGVAIVLTAASGVFALSRAVATDDSFPAPPAPGVTTTVPAVTTTVPAGTATVPAGGATTTTVLGVTTTEAGGGAAATTVAAPTEVAVEISNFQFSPAELTIPVGTTVVWTNADGTQHSVLANDGSFTSPPMAEGATFSFTFTQPGTYSYICGFHTSMSATITVTG